MIRLRHSSTLFPYTTLFRSQLGAQRCREHRPPPRSVPLLEDLGPEGGESRCSPVELALGRRRPEGEHHRGEGRVAHRSEEHTSELQSQFQLVCRLLLEKKKM